MQQFHWLAGLCFRDGNSNHRVMKPFSCIFAFAADLLESD